jgi:hypothetical protein
MAKRPYHINLATQKNRLILKRAIKILGVTFCGETSATQARAVTKAGTSYTRDDLEATTAYVRTLAPRATGYETAERLDVRGLSDWASVFYFLDADGSDMVRADGTRVSPMSISCANEEQAIRRATEGNIDRIDKIERPGWFTVGGSRKVRWRYCPRSPLSMPGSVTSSRHTGRLHLNHGCGRRRTINQTLTTDAPALSTSP